MPSPHLRSTVLAASVLCLALLAPMAASAQTQQVGQTVNNARPTHQYSVTVSPLHLITPLVEVMGEYRVADNVGVAVIGGLGFVEGVTLLEGGAQAAFYLLGDFSHGLQLGAEVLAIYAGVSEGQVSSNASGLGGGPFLGYKVAADFGLTFLLQAGYAYMNYFASASDGRSSVSASADGGTPLLNINLGWSF